LEEPGRLSDLTDLEECVHMRLLMPHIAHRIEIMPGRKGRGMNIDESEEPSS